MVMQEAKERVQKFPRKDVGVKCVLLQCLRMQVMGYLSWKEGMHVLITHQMQKALPSFVLDSLPQPEPAENGAAPKRSAEAPPDDERPSPVRARIGQENNAPVPSTSGVHCILAPV